ncbi:MAG: family 20 glycosylhydrolase [Bacteroidales bacterium]
MTDQGLFRARSTLSQLIDGAGETRQIPCCKIVDYPAFQIRGFMHDVGRHFIPISELEKEITILSRFKINTFHWHLTEDVAWRLASDIAPELTAGAVSTRDTGYYTKEEVRRFVNFCKAHHVTVIPEIDMPGHSAAFTRATGYSMQSPEGKRIVKELLIEACELFDTPWFHIGTDEVEITDPDFATEMAEIVRCSGKEPIGWLPGADLGEPSTRQLWIGTVEPPPGKKVIDSRFLYLNHMDPFADLFGIFNSRICGSENGSDDLFGAICCIWNDRKPTSVKEIILSNAFYPVMLAFAERAWRGGGHDIRERGVNLPAPEDPDLEPFGDFEDRMLLSRLRYLPDEPFPYFEQADIHWRITDPFPNQGDLSKVFPPERRIRKSYRYDGKKYPTRTAAGATVYLRHTWGGMVPGFIKDPRPDHTAYAYTYVYSPHNMEVGLWAGFHIFGRSEKDATPPAGEWDYKGSRIWINNQPIDPPAWAKAGFQPVDLETPYVDENYWMREPIPVNLSKGWNKILLKMPVGRFTSPQARLTKWMFTALIVSADGRSVPEGLIFSPEGRVVNSINLSTVR